MNNDMETKQKLLKKIIESEMSEYIDWAMNKSTDAREPEAIAAIGYALSVVGEVYTILNELANDLEQVDKLLNYIVLHKFKGGHTLVDIEVEYTKKYGILSEDFTKKLTSLIRARINTQADSTQFIEELLEDLKEV